MVNRPIPEVMSAESLIGDRVINPDGEDLGKIEEIMIEMDTGKVNYAVLSFGGIMGMGDKLFAIPWHLLRVDPDNRQFVLNIEKERLKTAPGFDKNDWPRMADPEWSREIGGFYGQSQSYQWGRQEKERRSDIPGRRSTDREPIEL
jgi:sporulation protein YlmC with PRC-barrel domain